jgi:hypothetical protein
MNESPPEIEEIEELKEPVSDASLESDTNLQVDSNEETNSTSTKESEDSRKKQMAVRQRIRSNSISTQEEEVDQDEEFNEAVKKYYRLKNEYEESFQNQKKKILSMNALSLKEKRSEYRKLKKKCVNCKRPVGTIFNTKVEGDSDYVAKDRHLIALCGDRNDPCPLNIDINLAATTSLQDFLSNIEKQLNNYKNQVIRDKNDLLFGYITSAQAVEKFDEIKNYIKDSTELFDLYFEFYNDIIDNPKKKEEYQVLMTSFYENVDSFKSMIDEFDGTGITQYVIEAVELYKNEILPQTEKIMGKTYAYSGVDYDEDDKTYHLDQKKHTIKQFEIDYGNSDHSIISMKTGMTQKVRQTFATMVQNTEERIPALKPSLKSKPKLVIQESSDDTN